MGGDLYCQELVNFLNYLEVEKGFSPGTVAGYRTDLLVFFRFLQEVAEEKPQKLQEIEKKHLRAFLAYLKRERNNGPAAMNRKIAALSSFCKFLLQEESLEKDPTEGLTRVKGEKKLPQYLSEKEARELLATVKKTSKFPERDYAIFLLFLQTGCRLSELAELTLENLDLEEGKVRFLGKGGKERIVPLLDETRAALCQWLGKRGVGKPGDRVFLNRYGNPLGKRGIQQNLRRFLERGGIYRPGLSVHKLRHTCLTLLLKSGVNLKVLKEIAGHTTISTTEIYTHVTGEEISDSLKKHPFIREKPGSMD